MTTDYTEVLYSLIKNGQVELNIEKEALKAAEYSIDVGLDSLTLVLLVGDYLTQKGQELENFNPDWLLELGTVRGIESVLSKIDVEYAE